MYRVRVCRRRRRVTTLFPPSPMSRFRSAISPAPTTSRLICDCLRHPASDRSAVERTEHGRAEVVVEAVAAAREAEGVTHSEGLVAAISGEQTPVATA